MFRVKASEVHRRISMTGVIILGTLVIALALSTAAVYQVFGEYQLLGTWLDQPVPAAEIADLRQEIGTRIIVRSAALVVLLLCTGAMLWLQQRQLAMRRTLHQVKLLARDILASMDQGVITTDRRDVVTSINSAATRILGVHSECVGHPLARIASAGEPLAALVGQVAERHAAVWDRDFTLERDGRARQIRSHAHVLKDAAGAALGCVVLLRDMSDRILMEEQVHRMERFLSLGNLASGLHHEIKNPLTALSIHVQLLDKRLRERAIPVPAATGQGPTDSEAPPRKPVEELIGVVKCEVLRLNDVLESFRDFASLQRMSMRLAAVGEILEEVVLLIRPQAEQQHIEVTLHPSDGRLPPVPLDVEKFKQAVLNLVVNALEAMPGGGRLELGARVVGGQLLVEVGDTGPGIAPEIRDNIFKPYFSTKTRGTGMGLALTEKLVGQHGGRLVLQTGPRGTTFFIALPLTATPLPQGKNGGNEREPALRPNGEP